MVPSYKTGPSDDVYALEVLSQILGGGPTSRLYRQLVVDDARWPRLPEPGTTPPGGAQPSCRSMPARALACPWSRLEDADGISTSQDIVRDSVTDAEIERAKNGKLADVVYARDSLSTGARVLGEALAIGLSVDDVEEWPERIRAVTKAQIDAVAKQVFGNSHAVTALLLPEEAPAPEPSQ